MAVKLLSSSNGSVTLDVPVTASNFALTLPAANGTVITTGSSGQSIPKAALPTGSVLQVVQTVNSTAYSGTSGAEVYTGMSASITPQYATSKILVFFQTVESVSTASTNAAVWFLLRRGTSTSATLLQRVRVGGYRAGLLQVASTMTLSVLDSPATTSAVTYGIFETNIDGTNSWALNESDGISNLILMEIAA